MKYSIEQLKAFVAVAQSGSFSKAAKQTFRTQSAVSIQINKLENSLNRVLFSRTTKSLKLTEGGILFLDYAQQIFSLMAQAEQALIDLDQKVSGRLVLSTSDTTACYRLPHLIQAYKELYPQVDIQIKNATSLVCHL